MLKAGSITFQRHTPKKLDSNSPAYDMAACLKCFKSHKQFSLSFYSCTHFSDPKHMKQHSSHKPNKSRTQQPKVTCWKFIPHRRLFEKLKCEYYVRAHGLHVNMSMENEAHELQDSSQQSLLHVTLAAHIS